MQDKLYWEAFYAKQSTPFKPSLFAQWCSEKYLKSGMNLLELGCGNGRDAFYFASQGLKVIAVDQCENELSYLSTLANAQITFKTADFTTLEKMDNQLDCVYSRFTLHSVTAEAQERTLKWAYDSLNKGGFLCVEVRGELNELFLKGNPVDGEKNAFVFESHYRRFLNFNEICSFLSAQGLTQLYAQEACGFAPYLDSDECFIRLIYKK